MSEDWKVLAVLQIVARIDTDTANDEYRLGVQLQGGIDPHDLVLLGLIMKQKGLISGVEGLTFGYDRHWVLQSPELSQGFITAVDRTMVTEGPRVKLFRHGAKVLEEHKLLSVEFDFFGQSQLDLLRKGDHGYLRKAAWGHMKPLADRIFQEASRKE